MSKVVVTDELISSIENRENKIHGVEADIFGLWWEQGRDIILLQEKTGMSGRKVADAIGVDEKSVRRYTNIFKSKPLSAYVENAAFETQLKLTQRVCEEIVKMSDDEANEAIASGVMPEKEKPVEPKPKVDKTDDEADWDEDEKTEPKSTTELKKQNAALKKENATLLKALNTQEAIETLNFFIIKVAYAEMELRKIKDSNQSMFTRLSVPLKNALDVLGAVDKNFDGLNTIKKLYKAKAKKAHPDAGGTAEQFDELKKAYDLLKTHFK